MKNLALLIFITLSNSLFSQASPPNVVLIVCDDLNDYVSGMGGHPQARTPSMAKLAESGALFKRAYTNNPVCAPSRSSFLTGIYPHKSGNHFFDKWYKNETLHNSKTIMEYFRENGYHTIGTGKLMHDFKASNWAEFKNKTDYGPFVFDGKNKIAHPSVPKPFSNNGFVDGSFAALSDVPFPNEANKGWIYGGWAKTKKFHYKNANERTPTPDEKNATWAAQRLQELVIKKDQKPFFLAVGFIRPHTPLHVPQKYFDLFPLESVQLPILKAADAEDTHYNQLFKAKVKGRRYFQDLKKSYPSEHQGLRAFTQAYLAAVASVDDCIGQVMQAIDSSALKDNTIVILTSDHGWNMGEKDFLFKNSLWEESTRIPFIIRAPGFTTAGTQVEQPISLIDLYPTLIDLCGLTGDTRKNDKGAKLDGFSIKALLENPKSESWQGPAGVLMMLDSAEDSLVKSKDEHYALRTKRWRYIRYNNGLEELYDHQNDTHEWLNLASKPEYRSIKETLYQQLQSMLK